MSYCKEVKIYLSDGDQSVAIQENEIGNGMILEVKEEVCPSEKSVFWLYLNFKEAREIGKELIKYSKELEEKIKK